MVNILLPVGKHTLIFSLNGYEPLEKVKTLGPNEKAVLEVNLKKLPAGVSSNPDLGFLNIFTYNLSAQAKIKGIPKTLDLPIEYFELKYGSYPLKVFQSGYETKKLNVNIEKQKTTKIEVNLKRKTAQKALVKSLLFPGLGQKYYESKTKALIFSVTAVGVGALLANTVITYQDENSLVSQYQLDYHNATTASDIETTWQTYQSQVNTVNNLRSQLLMYGATFGATWIINVVDALLFNGLSSN